MTTNMSYDNLVLIEAYLEEALKDLNRQVFTTAKYDNADNKKRLPYLIADRQALNAAIAELSEYETYVCNHA